MLHKSYSLLAGVTLTLAGLPAFAQTTPPSPTPPAAPSAPAPSPVPAPTAAPPAPAANTIAAKVNGQPVYEAAIQRGLERVPPAKRAEARIEILNFLIDNILIEQYLQLLKVAVEAKDVDAKLTKIRTEMKLATKEEWESWLQRMRLNEAELKQEITADLRWNKYAYSVATDKVLREYFDGNKDMFDGTQVRARHILLTPPANDPKAAEKAIADLRKFKQTIEQQVAEGLKALPANTVPLDREKKRIELLENAFSDLAKKESACPSKSDGGDVNFFPRAGSMVEPFAKAAFALKPFEMSDVVQTQFGYHLILVTDRTGTHEVKFEDEKVKALVLEVYGDKLRDAMVTQARQKSKIDITPVAKP